MRFILLFIISVGGAFASDFPQLENPKVGPIVGHTTDTSTRLTGYAYDEHPETLMYLRFKPLDTESWIAMHQPLKPAYDNGSTFFLSDLLPGTTYEYQMGFTAAGADRGMLWDGINTYRFTTFAADGPLTFVYGSCRMDKSLGCFRPFERVADETMHYIRAGPQLDFFAAIGDQIYADIGDPAVPCFLGWVKLILQRLLQAHTEEQFKALYRAAFSTPYFRALCAGCPTYFMGDDHEVTDNYHSDTVDQELLAAAMRAYAAYQAIHTPAFTLADYESNTIGLLRRWYDWNVKGHPFFMLDQRLYRTATTMHGDRQFSALIGFLDRAHASSRDGPKFIFSPVCLDGGDDTWAGYPEERAGLLEHIRLNAIRNVFVLCGDEHSSFATTLTCATDPNFRVISIVSSPFYWPFAEIGRGRAEVAVGEFARVGDIVYQQDQLYAPYLGNGFTEIHVEGGNLTSTLYNAERTEVAHTVVNLQ